MGERRLDDLKDITSDLRWRMVQVEYDVSNNAIYLGVHETFGAADDADGWRVWKMTYDGNDNMTLKEGFVNGTWDGRAGYDWRP